MPVIPREGGAWKTGAQDRNQLFKIVHLNSNPAKLGTGIHKFQAAFVRNTFAKETGTHGAATCGDSFCMGQVKCSCMRCTGEKA